MASEMAATAAAPGRERLELEDIQRLLIQGYSRRRHACYALLTVTDRARAKAWLAAQIPRIGTAHPDDRASDRTRPDSRLAVAFSWPGLRALGFPDDDPEFEGFVGEFREGMVAPHRSRILGDTEQNAPEAWEWGGPNSDEIHVLLMVFAASVEQLRTDWGALEAELDGLALVASLYGYLREDCREHFGFRDGISQPYIEGSDTHLRPSGRHAAALAVKAGEFVLGHANEFGVRPASPSVARELDPGNARLHPHPEAPAQRLDFGRNGTYLVLRQLQQHVEAFDQFVQQQARALRIDPELLAAKLVGRWKSGAPLVLAPRADDPSLETENGFGFYEEDRHGLRCPLGAHIRRSNPRDSLASEALHVTPETSSLLANRHRLIRRGRLYEKEDGEKGILFVALNANLQRQFEFVQQHWINGDKFGGLLDERDPTVGAMPGGPNRMTLQGCPVSQRIEGIPPFVRVRGGAYFFMPGLRALGFLTRLPDASPPPRPRFGEVRPFRPRRWWAQADLQTLRREIQAWLRIDPPQLAKLSARREERRFPMRDGTGDVLLASYDHPARDAGRKPLALLIHGLPGSDKSAVVVHTAAALLRCGYPVLRLNLRGAGPSQGKTQQLYHAGRSQDLHQVLEGLPAELSEQGVVLVAYSLGANMLLKALGEGIRGSVRGAVAISAPLDLAETAQHLLGLRGYRRLIYVRYLLCQTKRQVLKLKGLKPAQREAIAGARSFQEFDERFLARFSGFDGADDYYDKSSSGQFLAGIQVPTLLIHAPNDPIVPVDAYHRFDWKSNPKLYPLLSAAGGHAGFHGRGSPVAWHDRVLRVFLERLPAVNGSPSHRPAPRSPHPQ